MNLLVLGKKRGSPLMETEIEEEGLGMKDMRELEKIGMVEKMP